MKSGYDSAAEVSGKMAALVQVVRAICIQGEGRPGVRGSRQVAHHTGRGVSRVGHLDCWWRRHLVP